MNTDRSPSIHRECHVKILQYALKPSPDVLGTSLGTAVSWVHAPGVVNDDEKSIAGNLIWGPLDFALLSHKGK